MKQLRRLLNTWAVLAAGGLIALAAFDWSRTGPASASSSLSETRDFKWERDRLGRVVDVIGGKRTPVPREAWLKRYRPVFRDPPDIQMAIHQHRKAYIWLGVLVLLFPATSFALKAPRRS